MAETKMTSTNTVWVQAIAAGAFTLIPARKYPAWLRHTLTWGSAAGMFALFTVPGAAKKLEKLTSGNAGSEKSVAGKAGAEKPDVDGSSAEPSDDARADVEDADTGNPTIEKMVSNPVMRMGVGTVASALTYGLFRFSFWFDEAAERGLRRMRVPYPRVVMGVGTAALYGVSEEFERRSEARAAESPDSDAR